MTDATTTDATTPTRSADVTMTRRALLAAGGGALAGMAVGGVLIGDIAVAADTVQTYALDPTIGGTCLAPGCSVCNACLAHAANKIFETIAAAEASRAHPGCLCTVVPGLTVAQTIADQLFTAGPVVDRRWAAVGALLGSAPASVVAPGISGVLPAAITVGGVLTIGLVAARRWSTPIDR
jgi:hypothetical protein